MKDTNILLRNSVNIEKSLELFGDMETYDETMQEFLHDIEDKLNDLKNYKEIADMNNYAILVHSLKSDAKYFGFEEVAELCFQHETESKANNIYYVYDNFDELIVQLNKMINVSKMYLSQTVIEEKTEKPIEALSETILVVDDSDVIQNFIKRIFVNKYNVITARNGSEAIDIIIDGKYNMVGMLLDLNMPHLNGFAVLNFFEKEKLFDKVPVVIITGTSSEDIVNQTNHYPIFDILRKPFNERVVKDVVDKMVK